MESSRSIPYPLRAGGKAYSLRSEYCTGKSKIIDKDQVLHLLNAYRSQHGVPPLEWSDTCARRAQLRANHQAEEATDLGENLARSSSEGWSEPTAACIQALEHWQREETRYDYDRPGLSSLTDRFTTNVWRLTTHVGFGVGKAIDKGKKSYYVAAYFFPKGNRPGEYNHNVLPKGSVSRDNHYIVRRASGVEIPTDLPPTFVRVDTASAEIKELKSADGRFRFLMQEDRNIVVLQGDRILWDSGSNDTTDAPAGSASRLVLQSDGNLIAFDSESNIFWSSGSTGCGRSPYRLTMQDDGHCVLYDGWFQSTFWDTRISIVERSLPIEVEKRVKARGSSLGMVKSLVDIVK